jgi:outer membrane lipoprotein-sorting protein
MKRILNLLLAVLITAASSSGAAEVVRKPDPIQLLEAAYAGPAFSYQGQVLLTQWSGKEKRAEEVNVFFAPPGRYRLEFLAPDGSVDRIVLGDGQREQVQLVKQGKVFAGYATEVSPRLIPGDEERRLLLANYRIALSGTEDIMGRSTWVLDLEPQVAGKPSQRMWIDRESNAVLEVKRSLSDGGASSQFTRFEKKALPDSLFGQDASIQSLEIGKPAENPEEARKMTGDAGDRASLNGGFALMGADLFDVRGETVRHLRYTDGLIPVSLFVTRVAVEAPKISDAAARPAASPMYFGLAAPVNVSQWKQGKDHFTLIGELEPSLLQRISADTHTN